MRGQLMILLLLLASTASAVRLGVDSDGAKFVRAQGTIRLLLYVEDAAANGTLDVRSLTPDLLNVVYVKQRSHDDVPDPTPSTLAPRQEFWATIRGDFVGHGRLKLTWTQKGVNATREVALPVLRSTRGLLLGRIFTWTMAGLIAGNTFLMGTQLEPAVIRATLRAPVGPGIGLGCQFLLMPLLAFFWGSLILSHSAQLQLGYFAIGCSPGGGNSNFWTILLDGNLDLSVTMTAVSSVVAFVAMPAWFYSLGRVLFPDAIQIPFRNMGASLLILIVPCFLGYAFRYARPQYKDQCRWLTKATSILMLTFVLTFGSAANLYVFRLIRPITLLAGLALPWTGYAVAYGVAAALGRDGADRLTIAIETGIQNGGIAILVLRFSLPEPDSDLTMVMPICVMLFTSVPLWGLFLYRHLVKRVCPESAPLNREEDVISRCSTQTTVSFDKRLSQSEINVDNV